VPDRGLLEARQVDDAAFGASSGLTIASARWLQLTFEVDRQAALENMPGDVGRPIPPYGRLLVAQSPELSMAVLSVGGRYKMMPRNIVVATVTDGSNAADGLFGQGASSGRIALDRDGQGVTATISGPEGRLVRASLPSIYAIEPSMLRWDAFVALARADGEAVIGEITPSHTLETAFLCKGAELVIDAALPRTHAWRRLRSLGIISACYAEGSLSFSEPVVQQTLG